MFYVFRVFQLYIYMQLKLNTMHFNKTFWIHDGLGSSMEADMSMHIPWKSKAYFLNVFWTVKDGIVLVWVYRETNKYCTKREKERDTVDGKNPAPPGMYPKPL